MFIQPDSIIRLIRGCHIDNSYKDTIYFASPEEQKEYFYNTLGGITFTKQSYQRYADGVLHIQAKADDIYDCNYLMFQNTAFGNKWFYAFVNKIEYVNNVSSKVYYEIDVIQTWLWGLEINPCFIERTHEQTDYIGSNRIPENFDIGDYMLEYQDSFGIANYRDMCVVIEYQKGVTEIENVLNSMDPDQYGLVYYTDSDEPFSGVLNGGIYDKNYFNTDIVWCRINGVKEEDTEFLKRLIDAINIISFNGVRTIYTMPWMVMAYANRYRTEYKTTFNYTLSANMPTETIDGYEPKNKKLFTYPYCAVNIQSDNDTGVYLDDAYIDPEGDILTPIIVTCSMSEKSQLIAYPATYKGGNGITYGVQSSQFPMAKFVTDKITEWMTTDALSTLVGLITSSASLSLSQVSGDIKTTPRDPKTPSKARQEYLANKTASNFKNISGIVNQTLDGIISANSSSNGGGSGMYATENGGQVFVYVATIRYDIAKIIDDYFTMFGYAIKSIRQPTFNNREYFTFIKTNGFSVHANNDVGAPSSALRKIEEIHDNGITYWQKYSNIGDYSQTNRPLLEVDLDE